MARKDKLEADFPSFDTDLDFDFNTDIGGSIDQSAKKKGRSVVNEVITGAIDGAKDTIKSPSFIKDSLEKSLPSTYGEITTGLGEVTSGLYSLHNEAVGKLKPQLAQIVRKVDELVPDESKRLKNITGKLRNKLGVSRDSGQPGNNDPTEQAVTTLINSVFEQNRQYTKDEEKKTLVKEQIDQDRHQASVSILREVAKNTSISAQYTTNVTQAFQKKSLELQMRGYLAQKHHFAIVERYLEAFKVQNEAIVKNTSLPEYVKIKDSERFKEQMKSRMIGSVSNMLYGEGSAIKRGMDRLKKTGSEAIDGAMRTLENANMGLDSALSGREQIEAMNEMLVSMGEKPLTKAGMAGGMIAAEGVGWVRDKVAGKVRKNLEKDNAVTEKLAKAATLIKNPGAAIADLRKRDSWQEKTGNYDGVEGKVYRGLDFLLEHFVDSDPKRTVNASNSDEDLSSPMAGFDKKAHISLVDIIPGHLAAIHRELIVLRTGDEAAPLRTYDYQRNEFVDQKEMGRRLMGNIQKKIGSSGIDYYADKAASNALGSLEVSPKVQSEVKRFMGELAQIQNLSYTPENIRKTSAYAKLSPEAKSSIEVKLSAMETDDIKFKQINSFTDDIQSIRSRMPSLNDEIGSYVSQGHGDLLAKEGLLKKNEDGDFDIDEEELRKLLLDHGVMTSDENTKQRIKTMSREELAALGARHIKKSKWRKKIAAELYRRQAEGEETSPKSKSSKWNPREAFEGIKKTKLFSWMYKKGEGTDSDMHAGPMAQDVRKNLGDSAAPEGKTIDLQSTLGATLASVQHLGEKIEDSGKNTYLELIQKDVSAIRERLESTGIAGLGGGSSQPREVTLGSTIDAVSQYGSKVLGGLFDKGKQVYGAAMEKGKKLYSSARDNIIKPAGDFIADQIKNKDSATRRGLESLFEKASNLAGTITDFGTKLITEKLPAGFREIKALATKAYDKVKETFYVAKDLYLPGKVEPVIRAVKLRAGFYRNGKTGEPIMTMEELMKCKDDIVDAAGNVILSLEEKAEGLYDRYGEKIKTMGGAIMDSAKNLIATAKARAMQGLEFAKETGLKAYGKVKDLFKGKVGTGQPMTGSGFSGESKYLKMGYQVWVDIRDILLGDIEEVRKRLNYKGGDASPLDSSSSDSATEVENDEVSDVPQQEASNEPRYSSGGGGGLGGMLGALGGKAKGLFNRITGGGKTDGESQSQSGRFGQVFENLKTRAGGMFNKTTGRAGGLLKKGIGKARGLLGGAASLVGGLFGGGSSEEGGSQESTTPRAEGPKSYVDDPNVPMLLKPKKAKLAANKRTFGDKDGDGDVDGSVEDRKEKQEALKASRTKKGPEADLSLRYKSEQNVLDQIASAAKNMFGMITDGLSSLLDFGGSILSKIPGIGKLAGVAGKAASGILGAGKVAGGAVLKGGAALMKGGFGLAGKGLLAGGKVAAGMAGRAAIFAATKAVPALAMGGLKLAGMAASGLAGALASPLLLTTAAVAAAGYGAYKLYKYATRNTANEYERIRLRQYGFGHSTESDQYNHRCYALEKYLLEGKLSYRSSSIEINQRAIKQEELLETFDIDPKDSEAVNLFLDWFKNRFSYFFLGHMKSLYKVDPKAKLDDVPKLPLAKRIEYLKNVRLPDGPYNYDLMPVKEVNPPLDLSEKPVLELIDALTEKLQAEVKEQDKPHVRKDIPKKDETGSKIAKDTGDAEKRHEEERRKREAEERKRLAQVNQGNSNGIAAPVGQGGEDGPAKDLDKRTEGDAKNASAPSSIPMAKGNIAPGEGGMQFLKLQPGVRLQGIHPAALKLFLGMAEEYGEKTGNSIQVNDGYRTYEEQAVLKKKYGPRAAAPGNSLHETGLAIDINSSDANKLEELGLMKKYGFTRPVGGETWHIEPAGIQKNFKLARSNPAAAAELINLSPFRGGGGYGTVPGATKYKRNHELAMSLLNVRGSEANEKTTDGAGGGTLAQTKPATGDKIAVSMPSGDAISIPSSSAAPVMAANDSSGKQGQMEKSESSSQTNNLPSPEEIKTRQEGQGTKVATGQEKAGEFNPLAATQGEFEPKPGETTAQSGTGGDSDVKSIIAKNAQKAGVEAATMQTFAAVESDMNPNAKSPTSSASGLFQFINSTWNMMLGKYGKKHNLPPNASPLDPNASSAMAAEYIKDNMRSLSRVKPNPSATDLYLAHFMGPGGANSFLKASPDAIAAEMFPKQASANKNIFFDKGKPRTIDGVYSTLSNKLSEKSKRYGINARIDKSLKKDGDGSQQGTDKGLGLASNDSDNILSSVAKQGQNPSTVQVSEASMQKPNDQTLPDTKSSLKQALAGGPFGGFGGSGADPLAAGRQQQGEPLAGPNMTGLENKLGESVKLQSESLEVLKNILENVRTEKVAEVLAAAVAAVNSSKASNDVKEEDNRNMGRTLKTGSGSVDFRRKSA